MENIEKFIIQHLDSNDINLYKNLWRIDISSLGGRGIFANRDIVAGEIIFIDKPLVIGPRVGKNLMYCVVCYSLNNIRACTNGCGLPLCSIECEKSSTHVEECGFIIKLNQNNKFNEISTEIFRCLVPIRTIILNNKSNLLNYFCQSNRNSFEVELIKSKLCLSKTEQDNFKSICSVLDLYTFETIFDNNNVQLSLRAMYSLASMMNHCCTPNTMHCYDNNQNIIVKSTKFIKKNSEIFTTYTSQLWGTTSRRHHLATTKQFWCHCNRCKDPTEFGTSLSGLNCVSKKCPGVLYPQDALNIISEWKCNTCCLKVPSGKIGIIQSALGRLLETIDVSDIENLISFLKDRLDKFVPLKNQIAIEIKCKIIWVLGSVKNYYFSDISDEHLIFKEQLCREILQLLEDLKSGQSSMRGLVLYELYRSLKEKSVRISLTQNLKDLENLEEEGRKYLQEAVTILDNDATAPLEIRNIVNTTKNGNCT